MYATADLVSSTKKKERPALDTQVSSLLSQLASGPEGNVYAPEGKMECWKLWNDGSKENENQCTYSELIFII
jgi:hypothetical protein